MSCIICRIVLPGDVCTEFPKFSPQHETAIVACFFFSHWCRRRGIDVNHVLSLIIVICCVLVGWQRVA